MRKFLKKRRYNEDMSLQITSMADIFMILLVFLLKSYSTGLSHISPSKDLKLPEAKTEDKVQESLKLEIASDSIILDEKPVVTLKDFRFGKHEIDGEGKSTALYNALMSTRKKQKLDEKESTLIVMADQETPYNTIKTVLSSVANTGFVDLKLVVVQVE